MANWVNRVIGLLAYSLSFMPFFSVQFKYSVQPVIVIKLCFLIPFSIDLYYISCFPRSKFCMVFAFPYFRFTLPQAPENLNFFFFLELIIKTTLAPYGWLQIRLQTLQSFTRLSREVVKNGISIWSIYIYIYTCDMLSFSRRGKVN